MLNLLINGKILKLILSSLIQLSEIKSIFLISYDFLGIEKLQKICFNSVNHQGG